MQEKPRSEVLFLERGLDADVHRSEVQLQPKLNFARVVSRGDRTEVTVGKGIADVIELRVVEGIEELRTEFELAATTLAEHKGLEQREVPVLPARTTNAVERQVAKGSSHCWGECKLVEPTLHRLRVADAAVDVGPVIGIGNDAGDVSSANQVRGATDRIDRL